MDIIRPIGPSERDIDPLQRVERAKDERERQEQQRRKRDQKPDNPDDAQQDGLPDGPVEGDDGHLHIDVRA